MDAAITDIEKTILARIVRRFLHDGKGTPIQRYRKDLGKHRKILDALHAKRCIRDAAGKYFPTFKGISEQEADLQNLARTLATVVLRALEALYTREEKDTFSFEEILSAVPGITPGLNELEVRIGLILASELDHFYSWETEGGEIVKRVSLKESILDFESITTELRALEQRHASGFRPTDPVESMSVPAITQPLEQAIDFSFVRNENLRRIIQRDYTELQIVRGKSAWKSQIVLAGGLIEALLLDALQQQPDGVSFAARGERRPIDEWSLNSLINVSVELGLLGEDAHKLSHSLRDYRNLVHPGCEVRAGLVIDQPEAEIAVNILQIVLRNLRE